METLLKRVTIAKITVNSNNDDDDEFDETHYYLDEG